MMTRLFKVSFVVAIIGSSVSLPAMAQSVGDTELRLNQMEDQMRQLVGQVEQLTFTVKQLQNQLAASRKSTGQAEEPAVPQAPPAKKLASKPTQQTAEIEQQSLEAPPPAVQDSGGGLEQIEDVAAQPSDAPAAAVPAAPRKMATISGGLSTAKSAEAGDGGFQGQVLVAPGGEPVADAMATAPAAAGSDGVQNVALETDDPKALFRKANVSLANWQYGEAEQGFSEIIKKYPNHSLAGPAQYWLGETYYKQQDYLAAAKTFMASYQNYPKSGRAPDSLLRLGMSLGKMGEKEKACKSFSAVGAEFPNAVDVKKRAQVEFRRAGC